MIILGLSFNKAMFALRLKIVCVSASDCTLDGSEAVFPKMFRAKQILSRELSESEFKAELLD